MKNNPRGNLNDELREIVDILIEEGKVYCDGEVIGEIDSGVLQDEVVVNEPSDEAITVMLPFVSSRFNRKFRTLIANLDVPRYGPCIDCGNPAKGCHCFKCQQKRQKSV